MKRRDHEPIMPNVSAAISAELSPQLVALRDRLLEICQSLESCVVAYSGGVDSAVVAKACHLALGERAIAVMGESDSVAAGEVASAVELAAQIGIACRVVRTAEFQKPEYVRNSPDRCYHCKTELYDRLTELAPSLGVAVVVSGTNADDLGDYRPGLTAAREHAVRSPLAEAGLTKADVRQLAAHWGLPVYDKPATPCLSSRVAYGEEVTPERLRMIDAAEQYLRSLGLGEVRVRYHRGDLARIEAPLAHVARLADPAVRAELAARLRAAGFRYVTLDLEGFRSGSQNAVLGGLPILT
jgi:uncharacterized protein